MNVPSSLERRKLDKLIPTRPQFHPLLSVPIMCAIAEQADQSTLRTLLRPVCKGMRSRELVKTVYRRLELNVRESTWMLHVPRARRVLCGYFDFSGDSSAGYIDESHAMSLADAWGSVRSLDLSYTAVTDVSALGGVHTLDMSNASVAAAYPSGIPDDLMQFAAHGISGVPAVVFAARPIDVSPLAGVHTLNLAYNNLSGVSALGNVHTLNLSGTTVTDVAALGNVHALNLSRTVVHDVSALGNVHELNLSYTAVRDVSALGGVHTLDLSDTLVSDVSALGGVHTLNLSRTSVRDVSALGRVHTLDVTLTWVEDFSSLGTVDTLIVSMVAPGLNDIPAVRNLVLK